MEVSPPASQSLLRTRPEVPRRPPRGSGLDKVVSWLKERQLYGPEYEYYRDREMYNSVTLEPITQTSQAVFQVQGEEDSGLTLGGGGHLRP